jgi:uncharacterized protein (TIGR03086 family)
MADRVPIDFDSPVHELARLLLGVTDNDLAGPTPCPDWSVGDLLAHIVGLTWAFTQAARKQTDAPGTSSAPPRPSVDQLPQHWRSRLPGRLEGLSQAWKDPGAWTGTTMAGGATLPGAQMGLVACTEIVMHSWDLARSTDQEFSVDPRILEPLIEFLAQGPAEGTPGLFGPRVRPDEDAEPLEQALCLAGRDPHWRPAHLRPLSAPSTSAAG